MRRSFRALVALYPIVTFAALSLAAPAFAQPRQPAITWYTDYQAARKEANEKGLPLLVVVGTDNCFYCRKLEAGPLRDPAITKLLGDGYVALKLDATGNPELAKALKMTLYPTTVLAAPDGKIHTFIEGYVEADRLAEQLKRTTATVATTDWAARDFNEASKALAASDYPRAVTLLKGIVKSAGEKPVGAKSKQLLDEVERTAAGQLAKARVFEERGQINEAMDVFADAAKKYAGTRAALDATSALANLAEKPEEVQKRKARLSRDLLAVARDDFRTGRLYDCMQKCEQLALAFAEQPEARDALALIAEIKNNPERLAKACEQMNDRTAAMYMALAESWSKKGQPAEAAACLKKVVALCPNTRHAELAQAELLRINSKGAPAIPAGLTKP
jgi:tetratricopeptide (TPR) repeat protein